MIIVRRGDTTLFDHLRERFADDSGTLIVYDRRIAPGRTAQQARSNGDERRLPDGGDILSARGFYVFRQLRPR